MVDKFVKQLDGCSLCGGRITGGFNCTCACHAMWLYRASGGAISTTACHVRDLTDDCVGGTRLEQMNPVSSHFGIPAGTLFKPATFGHWRALILTNRYGSHNQIGYRAIAGSPWDCFHDSFRGGHDWYIHGGDENFAFVGDPGADGRQPGIPNGWQKIPWDEVERASNDLPIDDAGHTLAQEFGSGHVYALLTPPDPITVHKKYTVTMVGVSGHTSTYTPLYSRPNGTRLGSVSKASYVVEQWSVNSIWWYRILTKLNGAATANRGRFFKPSRYTKFGKEL